MADLAMLESTLASLYNWFDVSRETGTFTVAGGAIQGLELLEGQYYRIVGSVLNDGLHQYGSVEDAAKVGSARVGTARTGSTGLQDETFEGEVWSLAIPQALLDIVEEMSEWQEAHPTTGYTSESFGGYSYSLPTNSETGLAATVFDVFRARLNPYRKLPSC